MNLTQFLEGMRAATTAQDLERAVRCGFGHPFSGPTWSRICRVRIDVGRRICDAHPHGFYVPKFGPRRNLTVCGESYRVSRGGNSTGVRYAWHYAREWATGILLTNGFTQRGVRNVWESAFDYPHRALLDVAPILAGKVPDPKMNRLGRAYKTSAGPVTVNRKSEAKDRAHRDCPGCASGWLWDWGCGWDGCMNFINWWCDQCPRVYTEYVTEQRLREIRQLPRSALTAGTTAKQENSQQ